MKQHLLKAWRIKGWLACFLWPLAQIYGLLVRVRHTLYRNGFFLSTRFKTPIVVVGNVVAGGAGKTPLVIALVKYLQAKGLQVGVVSRGYGRHTNQETLATLEITPNTPIRFSGDEPALIQRATNAPTFVATQRTYAVRALLAAYPATDVVICDDGLQHYALQRDIEIAVFDDRGVGNGWLLPAGPLREPWPARQRQGINLILHTGLHPAFQGFTSHRRLAKYAIAVDGSQIALSSLYGQPLAALAGIANPDAFFAMLRACGLTLDKTLSLPDHHDFEKDDLSAYAGQTVLCTEKDAVKLFARPSLLKSNLRLLAVPLEFLPESAFFDALDELLNPLLLSSSSSSPSLSPSPESYGHQTT